MYGTENNVVGIQFQSPGRGLEYLGKLVLEAVACTRAWGEGSMG